MYVCVCHAVTDSQIRQAVTQGACSMRLLRQELNVASSCGKCACMTQELLKQSLQQLPQGPVAA